MGRDEISNRNKVEFKIELNGPEQIRKMWNLTQLSKGCEKETQWSTTESSNWRKMEPFHICTDPSSDD